MRNTQCQEFVAAADFGPALRLICDRSPLRLAQVYSTHALSSFLCNSGHDATRANSAEPAVGMRETARLGANGTAMNNHDEFGFKIVCDDPGADRVARGLRSGPSSSGTLEGPAGPCADRLDRPKRHVAVVSNFPSAIRFFAATVR